MSPAKSQFPLILLDQFSCPSGARGLRRAKASNDPPEQRDSHADQEDARDVIEPFQGRPSSDPEISLSSPMREPGA